MKKILIRSAHALLFRPVSAFSARKIDIEGAVVYNKPETGAAKCRRKGLEKHEQQRNDL
ncbi:MAG: hypothetical protein IJU56_09945 [Clostridia bacterium]|nr:hypothetical protein [Clostridia bacterium]